jgi:uncharacterized protein (UPF0332 family)
LDNIKYHIKEAENKYYSKALAKGKDIREIADYEVIAEISEEEAESVIDDAEKFLVRIKEAIKEIQKKLD